MRDREARQEERRLRRRSRPGRRAGDAAGDTDGVDGRPHVGGGRGRLRLAHAVRAIDERPLRWLWCRDRLETCTAARARGSASTPWRLGCRAARRARVVIVAVLRVTARRAGDQRRRSEESATRGCCRPGRRCELRHDRIVFLLAESTRAKGRRARAAGPERWSARQSGAPMPGLHRIGADDGAARRATDRLKRAGIHGECDGSRRRPATRSETSSSEAPRLVLAGTVWGAATVGDEARRYNRNWRHRSRSSRSRRHRGRRRAPGPILTLLHRADHARSRMRTSVIAVGFVFAIARASAPGPAAKPAPPPSRRRRRR